MTSINILKKKVMNTHSELVRNGEFDVAYSIMRFLKDRQTTLGLGDVSMKVEKILDDLGCFLRYAIDSYFMHRKLRDRVMFALGIYTGRRISDLVKLNVRDIAHIDRKGRLCVLERLVLQEQKTGKFADLLIHPKVRRILSKYLRQRRKHSESVGVLLNEPLLKSRKARRDGQFRITKRRALRVLTNAAKSCGLNYKIGTHSLRKTFGYIQYQNGTSIELIQRMLNHSSPEITLSYIGITRDDIDDAILSMDW